MYNQPKSLLTKYPILLVSQKFLALKFLTLNYFLIFYLDHTAWTTINLVWTLK